jgi:hypothetical protein
VPGGSGLKPGGNNSPAEAVRKKADARTKEIAPLKIRPGRFMDVQCAEESAARQAGLERERSK